MSTSLFSAPHPLVPLATFPVAESEARHNEECSRRPHEFMQTYAKWGPDATVGNRRDLGREGEQSSHPDFLGRLHQMKTLMRMSATEDPISLMIHRAGPLLILDDGPRGWTRGGPEHHEPLDDLPCPDGAGQGGGDPDDESELTLAELDSALKMALLAQEAPEVAPRPPPGLMLPEVPQADVGARMLIKNTFLEVQDEKEDVELGRTQSAPARIAEEHSAIGYPAERLPSPRTSVAAWSLALAPVLQEQSERGDRADAGNWSLIPYEPDSGTPIGPSTSLSKWDLLQLASTSKMRSSCSVMEAMQSLYPGIPQQPSRFGRAVAWRCGPYKILLGCDLVVFRSDDQSDVSDCVSCKMLPGSAAGPSREDRLDVYLENVMCDIKQVVWGTRRQEQTTWRLSNTEDLPGTRLTDSVDEDAFDPESLMEEGQRLLHFLRQKCHKQGGTYWLFREANSPTAELFDLSDTVEPSHEDVDGHSVEHNAFKTTESLVLPIASLCLRLAKSLPDRLQKRQLLQKSCHLLEPVRDKHVTAYAMAALELACLYMKTPQAALPDLQGRGQPLESNSPPPAARLSVALRHLESILAMPNPTDDDHACDGAVHKELLLQADVAYAECIVRMVREAFIPTYSSWLNEVQQNSQELLQSDPEALNEMKRISVAFLIWRLFWLCRAQTALNVLPQEKREVECWVLDRDVCELMGDALYGLSRYPAADVDNLTAGAMRTAEDICQLVEQTLRNFGLGVPLSSTLKRQPAVPQKKRKPRITSPNKGPALPAALSPKPTEEEEAASSKEEPVRRPQCLTAMFLSRLNPLRRNLRDAALREEALVRDDLRRKLWTERLAFQQSLALFERATARLKKSLNPQADGEQPPKSHSLEEQATMKIARKLAHLYNEEARTALLEAEGTERAQELLTNAHHWMFLSGDLTNASRVLLNLSELHARQAERMSKGENGSSGAFTVEQYQVYMKAIQCASEATRLAGNKLGAKEAAFGHLRLGVHLATRAPAQARLEGAGAPEESLLELADKHISKALHHFDELQDEREVAVCHFHLADLAVKEHSISALPLSRARLTSATRHARRSAAYWERAGCLQYLQDYLSAHVRVAKLLELQQKQSARLEALQHLAEAEERLLALAVKGTKEASAQTAPGSSAFIEQDGRKIAVTALRRDMGRICQEGLKEGIDMERLKGLYRSVLRNEPLKFK